MYLYTIYVQKNININGTSDDYVSFPLYLTHEHFFSQEEFETIIFTILKNYKLLIALSYLEFIDNSDEFIYNYDNAVKCFEESKHLKTINSVFIRYQLIILDILRIKYLFKEISESEKIDFKYVPDKKLF